VKSVSIGWIIDTIPSTKVIFTITLPTVFPRAIFLCFNLVAEIPKTNSGSVVAIDNKNNPINIFGKLNALAMFIPYFTRNLEDINNPAKARTKINTFSTAVVFFT